MTATQPTLNQVYDMACSLSYGEQQRLIDRVQGNLYEHVQRVEDTPDELKSRLREAHRQALAGDVLSQEEAHTMMDAYIQQRLQHRA